MALDSLTFHTQSDILQASLLLEDAIQIQSRVTNITLLLSLFTAIALALYHSWSITRPLTHVSRAAQQVSEHSNFDVHIPVKTNDEVGVLAASFNDLIYRVRLLLEEQKEAQQNLKTYNQRLESAVQERSQEIIEKNDSLEKMLAHLHETQAQLVQAEKMSSLGQLVAGIAHEINNPVNFIHGNLQYAESYFKDLLEIIALYQAQGNDNELIREKAQEIELDFLAEDVVKMMKSMQMGTERIREIVLSLRNFSRLDESDLKTVDLHEGLDSTLLILGHRFKANSKSAAIEIVKCYGDLPLVECFPGQLNQALMNVLVNAVDAFEEAGIDEPKITISTAQRENSVIIVIADNGPGISNDIKQRIFEPFFTTKDVGKGTGMGLSISYKIITERHQGQLACESTRGQGTTLTIELPVQPNIKT
ncbi:MAG: sensor histidine kinase [Phormidesmis sp.]